MFISPFDLNFFYMLDNFISGIKKKYGITDAQNASSLSTRDQRFADSGLSEDFRDRWNSAWSTYDPNSVQDTFWDSVSNFFGARSSADVLRMEKEQAREEALNQLINQKGEQDYSSEAEKIQRMREAGLNPDLQGIGAASDAVPSTEPEQRLDFSGLQTGADIAKKFSSAFMNALAMTQGLQSIRGVAIENSLKEAGTFKKFQDMAFDMFTGILSQDDFVKNWETYQHDKSSSKNFPISDKVFLAHGIKSHKLQKILRTHMGSLAESIVGNMKHFNTFEDYFKSRDKYVGEISHWYNNGDPFDDQGVRSALKKWFDFIHNVESKEKQLSADKSDYASEFYKGLNPTKAYESENAANEFSKYVTKQKEILYKKLTGNNPSTFELMLAVQLMGDVDFAKNSGVKGALDLIF